MRKIATGLFISLDGVVDADDDWQFPFFDEEMFAEMDGDADRWGAALMGRRSFAGYDALRTEHPESPMLAFLEGLDRYVVSATVDAVDWPGTQVIGGDVEQQLTALREEPGGDIMVAGSPTLVRWLLGRGLLDELNLIVLPILVGSGIRLFPEATSAADLDRLHLRLVESRALSSGALVLSYVPASRGE